MKPNASRLQEGVEVEIGLALTGKLKDGENLWLSNLYYSLQLMMTYGKILVFAGACRHSTLGCTHEHHNVWVEQQRANVSVT